MEDQERPPLPIFSAPELLRYRSLQNLPFQSGNSRMYRSSNKNRAIQALENIPRSYGRLYIKYHQNDKNKPFYPQSKRGEYLHDYKQHNELKTNSYSLNTSRYVIPNKPQNITNTSAYNQIGLEEFSFNKIRPIYISEKNLFTNISFIANKDFEKRYDTSEGFILQLDQLLNLNYYIEAIKLSYCVINIQDRQVLTRGQTNIYPITQGTNQIYLNERFNIKYIQPLAHYYLGIKLELQVGYQISYDWEPMWAIYKLFDSDNKLNEGCKSTIFYSGVREDALEILEGYTVPSYYKFQLNFRIIKPFSEADTHKNRFCLNFPQQYDPINPSSWRTTRFQYSRAGKITFDKPREFYNTVKLNTQPQENRSTVFRPGVSGYF